MKTLALIALVAGLTAVPAATAGGWHIGYYGGHGHYRPYHYRPYRHHGYYHRHRRHRDYYGAVAAGLVFGGILHAATRPAPVVVERRIYRRPVTTTREVYRPAPPAEPRGQPAPAEKPPYYYRRGADGSCDLIERLEDGSEIITPQPPEECD